MMSGVFIDGKVTDSSTYKYVKEYVDEVIPYNYLQDNYISHIIHQGESKQRGFNDYNRGSTKCTKSNRVNIKLIRMSINDVIYYQNLPNCSKNVLFAVGKWQLIPSTLKLSIKHLNLNKDQEFDEDVQNLIFVEYLTKVKRPAIYKYIITGQGLKLAARDVAREWASIGSPIHCKIPIVKKINGKLKIIGYRPWRNGGGCYDGLGTNRSLISATKNLKALQKARAEFLIYRQQGYSTAIAYKKSLGINE